MDTRVRITAFALLLGTIGLGVQKENAGTFTLQKVNGNRLPATVLDSIDLTLRIDALSGTFTINDDGSFSDATLFRVTAAGVVSRRTVICQGTYTYLATGIQFVEAGIAPDCGRTFVGMVVGNTLNASVRGAPAVFTSP